MPTTGCSKSGSLHLLRLDQQSSMKFLGLALVAPFARMSYMSGCRKVLNLDVGGQRFSLCSDDMHKHGNSLLQQLAQAHDDLNLKSDRIISVDRDGTLFQSVNAYLVNGQLPRDTDLLKQLSSEADYYGLPALRAKCQEKLHNALVADLVNFKKVHKYAVRMERVNHQEPLSVFDGAIIEHYWSNLPESPSPLFAAVHNLLVPKFVSGHNEHFTASLFRGQAYEANTAIEAAGVDQPDVLDLSAEYLHDTDVNYIKERCSESIQQMFPDTAFELRPEKLHVHTTGSATFQRGPANCTAGQIGTLMVFLDSKYNVKYEGGDVYISGDNRLPEMLPRDQNWVAVHANCTYKMDRVTSGARAVLELSILQTGVDKATPASDVGAAVLAQVESELQNADSIILNFQHLYPAREHNKAYLKQNDRALYDLLRPHYEVKVVSAMVYRRIGGGAYMYVKRLEGGIFTQEILDNYLANTPEKHERIEEYDFGEEKPVQRNKLFLVNDLTNQNLMHHTDCDIYATVDREDVFVVTGLQLRRREQNVESL